MYDIISSIVAFKNNQVVLDNAISCFLKTGMNIKLFVVDNSNDDRLRTVCSRRDCEYLFNSKNIGFGAGHNQIIKDNFARAKYYLILNPDIYFEKGTLEELYDFMEKNIQVGLVMPRILYPNGSSQHLCRLLPAPIDLIAKRINITLFAKSILARRDRYELRSADYNKNMEVPYLSGCFMFIRSAVFAKIGYFDERFFMYLEDVDICRRIHKFFATVYYPRVAVYHEYEKGSAKNINLLKYHIISAVRYFNKWGWFFDAERNKINQIALNKLSASIQSIC